MKTVYCGPFTLRFRLEREAKAALAAKDFLEANGFQLLGWSANEALYTSAAWKEVNGYVFALAGAYAGKDKISFHDNFTMPIDLNHPTQVFVWKRPIKPSEFLPDEFDEEWVMDGTPPSALNEENRELMFPVFHNLEAAICFCNILSK